MSRTELAERPEGSITGFQRFYVYAPDSDNRLLAQPVRDGQFRRRCEYQGRHSHKISCYRKKYCKLAEPLKWKELPTPEFFQSFFMTNQYQALYNRPQEFACKTAAASLVRTAACDLPAQPDHILLLPSI